MPKLSLPFSFLFFLMLSTNLHAFDKPTPQIKAMQSTGYILMIRHALAPGFGDPADIKIGDCSTQRNLNKEGRLQSTNIGKWLIKNKIQPSAIYTSQWCRCKETAKLLDIGQVEELPALNSFYQMPENRESSLNSLRQFISNQKTNNKLIIMVTHSVTISAISGQSVASGDGVLLKLNDSKPYEFVSVVSADSIN